VVVTGALAPALVIAPVLVVAPSWLLSTAVVDVGSCRLALIRFGLLA
jgi:hypothetical protein